jgi:L-asparagine transporter-like permease
VILKILTLRVKELSVLIQDIQIIEVNMLNFLFHLWLIGSLLVVVGAAVTTHNYPTYNFLEYLGAFLAMLAILGFLGIAIAHM